MPIALVIVVADVLMDAVQTVALAADQHVIVLVRLDAADAEADVLETVHLVVRFSVDKIAEQLALLTVWAYAQLEMAAHARAVEALVQDHAQDRVLISVMVRQALGPVRKIMEGMILYG